VVTRRAVDIDRHLLSVLVDRDQHVGAGARCCQAQDCVSRDNLDENGGGNLGVKRRPVATL
jgi:hypothetical protein